MASVRRFNAGTAEPGQEKPSQRPIEPPITKPDGVADDAIRRVIRVPPESAGMRLDVFMRTQLRNTSRTRARAIVENSAYSPDGLPRKANDRVRAEQFIVLWRAQFEEEEDPTPLPVVFEDEHLLVIDKPPLMTVHPTARYHKNTVIKRLQQERPGEFLTLVHRLDRETSGILLVARSKESERAFKRLLEDRSLFDFSRRTDARAERALGVSKTYLAITWGVPESGCIDLPLEPDADNPLRVKMRVAPQGRGLVSKTTIRVLDTRPGYALVACDLHTGRQHQIRVHLASAGCPVVGDKLYGPDERLLARSADGELTDADRVLLELPRHALHAHQYRMPHVMTGADLALSAPLARDLDAFWNRLPR